MARGLLNSLGISYTKPTCDIASGRSVEYFPPPTDRELKVVLAPNPTIGETRVSWNVDGSMHMRIYNSFGQLIDSQSSIESGNRIKLKGGFYFVEIFQPKDQQIRATEKLLIMNP
jgi:hypothetical protein